MLILIQIISANYRNQMLPSYQAVMYEKRSIENSELCIHVFGVGFLIANIFISLLTVGGFFLIRFTDAFQPRASNITKYCNDLRFNISPIPELSYCTAYVSISITFALCFVLLLATSNMKKYNRKKLAKKLLWKAWILGMHLMFLSIFIEFLKCAAGIPRPYFFSTQNMRFLHCENKRKAKQIPLSLEKQVEELLKSFPSYRSAVYAFCITFMYIYLDHFDINIGLHAIQQVLIICMGSRLTYFQFRAWEQGENHLSDILVGAGIGTIQAMITVRGMFGSVFSSHVHAFNWDFNPSAPPINFMRRQSGSNMLQTRQDLDTPNACCNFSFTNSELNHPLNTRVYESTQTIFADNKNDTVEEYNLSTNNVFQIQNQEETSIIITETNT